MAGEARVLTVAAVQMVCENGNPEGNRERASGFVQEAVGRGAKLVVLPEFMPNGYIYTREIWDTAEGGNGPTLRWMKAASRRHGIWLGTSFLEAEGDDFFNSFVITNPEGDEDGRVRKQTPAIAEAFFTRGALGPHVIHTDLGKMGVGICYENQLAYTPQLMYSQGVDLMLMPHSAPSPMPNPLFPARAVERFNSDLANVAAYYSRLLGVPVVMINKSGPWNSPLPLLPFLTQESSFPGLSTIADSDGGIKAQLGKEEGVIVEEVTLDPSRKTDERPACRGRWSRKVPWAMNQFRIIEAIGGMSYRLSRERKRRAREISSAAS